MGILNLAPDSFSSQGRCLSTQQAVEYALKLVEDGADLIDLGAEATNPTINKFNTDHHTECDRLLPVISDIRKYSDIFISIDTSDPKVMQNSIAAGANMINDVRALTAPNALEIVADLNVPVCLMHMAFPDLKVGKHPSDYVVTHAVLAFLKERAACAVLAGILPDRIVLDPGLGGGAFGKNTEENFDLLKATPTLCALGYPVLVGLSRKTFIGDVLNCPETQRVHGSLVLNLYAITQGASMIRTHDVKALRDSLHLLSCLKQSSHETCDLVVHR